MLIKSRKIPGFFVATLYHYLYIVYPKNNYMTHTMNLMDSLEEVGNKRRYIRKQLHEAIEAKDLKKIIQFYTIIEHMDEEIVIIECELEDLHN